ncbi:MAG: hypothetical protein WC400_00630 [Patescibacteria group bacterium]|jgi:hypothetical protein
MTELYSTTLKHFHLAIVEFLPELRQLYSQTSDAKIKEEIEDLIEAYEGIDLEIGRYSLNYDEPYRYYDGEPDDIEINISDEMTANLVQLTLRLLSKWKDKLDRIQKKKYFTDEIAAEGRRLNRLIGQIEPLTQTTSYVFGKYAHLGQLHFPGEDGAGLPEPVVINMGKTIKNKLKMEDLFIESRSQGEDVHLLIGKRDGTPGKAHVVIDAKTGDIRVEDNQQEPTELVNKVESILTMPNGKKIKVTREAIKELVSDKD